MWNEPTKEVLEAIPSLYSTEKIPLKEKTIYEHFFIGGCDWYVTEYDPEDQLFFGFAILNNDLEMAEWGYIGFEELVALKVTFLEVDRDLHFSPTKAKNIDKICEAQGWLEAKV